MKLNSGMRIWANKPVASTLACTQADSIQELSCEELETVSAGLTPTDGGLAMMAMSVIPGINVGLAAFALTTGLGFVIGNAWYGGGGADFGSSKGTMFDR